MKNGEEGYCLTSFVSALGVLETIDRECFAPDAAARAAAPPRRAILSPRAAAAPRAARSERAAAPPDGGASSAPAGAIGAVTTALSAIGRELSGGALADDAARASEHADGVLGDADAPGGAPLSARLLAAVRNATSSTDLAATDGEGAAWLGRNAAAPGAASSGRATGSSVASDDGTDSQDYHDVLSQPVIYSIY